jgi:hypothetical protein
MKIQWDQWDLGGKIIFVSTCLALLSFLLPWVDIGFTTRNGITQGCVVMSVLYIYPTLRLLNGGPIHKPFAISCAVLAIALTLIYMDSKTLEIFGQSVNASSFGAQLFLMCSIALIVGVAQYRTLEGANGGSFGTASYVTAARERVSGVAAYLKGEYERVRQLDTKERNARLLVGVIGGAWTGWTLGIELDGLLPIGTVCGWLIFLGCVVAALRAAPRAQVTRSLLRFYAWAAGLVVAVELLDGIYTRFADYNSEVISIAFAMVLMGSPIIVYRIYLHRAATAKDRVMNPVSAAPSRSKTILVLVLSLIGVAFPILIYTFRSSPSLKPYWPFLMSDAAFYVTAIAFIVGCCCAPIAGYRLTQMQKDKAAPFVE